MNIQGFQKLTLLDFPQKLACTVFCGGCNLRCPFCHNATLVRQPMASENKTEEVLAYLKQRKGILDGVCVTGGEPLLQPDIADFLRQVKELGLLVKLDTNGTLPHRLESLVQKGLVDYVAMDVKSAPETYPIAIGSDWETDDFLQSIDFLRKSGVDHEFRTTAVKGLHTERDFQAIADLLFGEERYFIQNFVDSGNLLGKGFAPFTLCELQSFLEIVSKKIPNAQLRGEPQA